MFQPQISTPGPSTLYYLVEPSSFHPLHPLHPLQTSLLKSYLMVLLGKSAFLNFVKASINCNLAIYWFVPCSSWEQTLAFPSHD